MIKQNPIFRSLVSVSFLLMCWLSSAVAATNIPAQIQQKAVPVIRQQAQQLFGSGATIFAGNPKGVVTLVEFYDYQCEHCRHMAPAIAELINKNTDLRVVFKPLNFLGYYSTQAALAAIAAYHVDPTKFLAFHKILMGVPLNSSDAIKHAAEAAGYDYSKIQKAIQSGQYTNSISANQKLAQSILKPSLGYIATPAVIVAASDTKSDSTAPITFIVGVATTEQQRLQQAIDQVAAAAHDSK
ncbi:MAG: thioredoxin domain-containing protein [Pseudomonadota bacterium]